MAHSFISYRYIHFKVITILHYIILKYKLLEDIFIYTNR